MIIAVVAVGLHTLPTTAIIVMSIAHRYLQKKREELSFFSFSTPSGCSGNALCARTSRFYTYGLVIFEHKCVS